MTTGDVRVFADLEALSVEAVRYFESAVRESVEVRGRFSIALSGGSTPKRFYQLLAQEPYRTGLPWEQIHLFWGDERYVPQDDPLSNYRMVRELLLEHISIPKGNVHAVPTGYTDLEEAARVHSEQLVDFFGESVRLDLALMGMGPDGHTASLFPGEAATGVRDRLVTVARPASQPTARLTFTYPVFNQARRVIFLVSGADKAEVLAKVLAGDSSYPSQGIQPEDGELVWFVDQAAGAKLQA